MTPRPAYRPPTLSAAPQRRRSQRSPAPRCPWEGAQQGCGRAIVVAGAVVAQQWGVVHDARATSEETDPSQNLQKPGLGTLGSPRSQRFCIETAAPWVDAPRWRLPARRPGSTARQLVRKTARRREGANGSELPRLPLASLPGAAARRLRALRRGAPHACAAGCSQSSRCSP